MNGILLSAGLGSRLRPFTDKIPKPAIPFMSVPLACYPLSLFEKQKIHNLVINTHHLPEKIEDLFRNFRWPLEAKPKNLIFSPEPTILGSGGGVRQAMQYLQGRGTFFVANADEVILPMHHLIIKEALEFHNYHKGIATLLCIKHPEVGKKFGGVWLEQNSETKVMQFSKTAMANHQGLHFVGVLLLNDSIKDYFFTDTTKEENILYDTLTKAMANGEGVQAMQIDSEWFETGNPQDFLSATDKCLNALAAPAREAWAEYLAQVICRCSTHQYEIENDQTHLKTKMLDRIAKVLMGIT